MLPIRCRQDHAIRFRCEVASRVSLVSDLNHALTCWALVQGVPAPVMHSASLVLDELFTNIVVHGYRHDPRGRIVVEATVACDVMEVTLTDTAPPFDPLRVPEPDTSLPLDERRIGGLGLLFVRRSADSFSYRLLPGDAPRNQVRFTKRLHAKPAQDSQHSVKPSS